MSTERVSWAGMTAADIRAGLGVPHLELFAVVDSTQDIAHRLAANGAPPGSVVLADAQRAGRGRHGRSWSSEPGRGIWCTIIHRPHDAAAADVLSLRVGLCVAEALDSIAEERVCVKWPNDLVLRAGKLGGILVEARWSGQVLSWVAIGLGVNVGAPDVPGAAGLPPGASRWQVLHAVVRSVTEGATATGWLTDHELARYAARDVLAGRRIIAPAAGVVRGVHASGALIVESEQGREMHRAGTIQLAEEP